MLEILQRCAGSDEALQTELLDEVEPLLFGYLRSLLPASDDSFERAVALTHAATLGFLLDLRAGRVRIPDNKALRGHCHRIALAKLRDAEPILLTAEGDEETGALTPRATTVAAEFEAVLPATLLRAAAIRLQGGNSGDWKDAESILVNARLVPERDT